MVAKPFFKATDVNSYYGKSHVLHDLNMEFNEGAITGLLGRNGVGKSTCLKTIMMLVPPMSGSVEFRGESVNGLRPYQIARKGIGFVPEERRIFPDLTVRENLIMGMKSSKNEDANQLWSIDRIYDLFPGLENRDSNRGGYLSGGEQQMLTIGRTLMGNPSLLLLDGPTEGLAPLLVERLLEVIVNIHSEGVTILLVEQKTEVVIQYAHSVFIMSKGEIVFAGSVNEFKERPDIRKEYLEV